MENKEAINSSEDNRLKYQGQLAQYNAEAAASLAKYSAETAASRELFKSVIDAGKEALNAIQLINGGAVVALLSFLANSLARGGSEKITAAILPALLYFGFGTLCGAVGFGIRYFTQFLFATQWLKTGHFFNILSWLVAIAGYVLFGVGLYVSYGAFAHGILPAAGLGKI
jgi:hypothetical protein